MLYGILSRDNHTLRAASGSFGVDPTRVHEAWVPSFSSINQLSLPFSAPQSSKKTPT